MDIKSKMNWKFSDLKGGLFDTVTKADVGEGAGNLMAQGYDIMAWADPFFPDPSIPDSVKKTMIAAFEDGFSSHYTMPMGNADLRRVVSKKLWEQNGIKADPSRNILITPGSDSGLLYAMMPFIGEGDEVLIPDPSYPSNFLNAKLCGGVAVPVPLREENNWQPEIDEFEKRVTEKTKMVLISHPNNPTSTVFRREAMEKLCRFVIEHDLILVSDQAFEDFIFDDIEFVSPAVLPGMWERTVTIFSISKGIGLSGFRVGYIVADDHIMDVLYGGTVNVLGATNTAAQFGAITALEDKAILKEYYEIMDKRRKLAYDIFKSIPGVTVRLSESGFLSWLNISRLGTSAEIVSYLIREAKVVVNEGTPYGAQGEGYIRIVHGCFKDEKRAVNAYVRIKEALTKLAKEKGIK
ncbi:MAG: LL-diaminopimelate aminotransferase [Firmicutes bacterium ADurb.Bin182]|nr:MAG: LL-diaminopimelate aminotransferase [Firmicutes bacterium ADurb.Bin182]